MSSITTHEIPKQQWAAFFSELDKQYRGWEVIVEALDPELGDQRLAEQLPLQGISYETRGSQSGDILVESGDKGSPYQTQLIRRPRAVRSAVTQPGEETVVEIESEDGPTVLVRLRPFPEITASPK